MVGNPTDLITLTEAADYFGRHPNTFRNYNKKGLLHFYRDKSRSNNPIQVSTAEVQRALGRGELEFQRGQQIEHISASLRPPPEPLQDDTLKMLVAAKDQLIQMLEGQLADYRDEVRALRVRRSELEAKIDTLQDKLANSPVALLDTHLGGGVPVPNFPKWDG